MEKDDLMLDTSESSTSENDTHFHARRSNPLDFDSFCTPFYERLISFARRLAGGDVQRAHDVVQDTMIRAMNAWDRFVPDASAGSVEHAVSGWLHVMVRNVFMSAYQADCRRRERHLPTTPEEGMREDREFATPDPRDDVDAETGDEVLEAIASLSPHHRQVIEMYYLQEMDAATIAAELGIVKDTVFTRLNRAKKALKKSLRAYAESLGRTSGSARKNTLEAPEYPETDTNRVDRVVRDDDVRDLDRRESPAYDSATW